MTLVPAATVVPARDGPDGPEVLLVRRSDELQAFAAQWVFPGGRVDDGDVTDDELDTARRTAVREAREETGLVLDAAGLVAWSHWTPPAIRPRRFATWFFVAQVAADAEVTVDGGEIVEHRWLRPIDALAERDAGRIGLVAPTFVTLYQLGRAPDVATALARPPLERFATVPALDDDGEEVLLWHGDAGYDDANAHRPGPRHRLVRGDTWRYERTTA